ncbi:hypothetical protein [Catellatospora methionotrophica]|uniref:hypothetical protein n=1 Tax=Catellatospora methionotrophica TaxID=121620 RepID=UPI0033DD5969
MPTPFPVQLLRQRREQLLELAQRTDDQYATANLGVEAHRIRTIYPPITWIIVQLLDADDSGWEYDYRCSTAREQDGSPFDDPDLDIDDPDLADLLDEFCYALRDSHSVSKRWPIYDLIADANLGFATSEESAVDADKARRGTLPKWVVINLDQLLAECRQLLDTGRLPQADEIRR